MKLLLVALATCAAVPQEQGREHKAWSAFKPGTWVKTKTEITRDDGKAVVESVATLIESTPQKTVVEAKVIVTQKGKAQGVPPRNLELLPTDKDEGQVVKKGEEDLTVAGKKLKCRWQDIEIDQNGQKSFSRLWLNDDVPGGMVKMETRNTPDGPAVIRVTTLGWEVKNLAGPVDLLAQVDLKRDRVEGEWTLNGKVLTSPAAHKRARIQLPGALPEEYDLLVLAERLEGGGAINLGLVQGSVAFCATIDGWDLGVSGLSLLDGRYANENESAFRAGVMKTRKPALIVCSIRKEGVTVTVDGRKIVDWKGPSSKLSAFPEMSVPDPRALYLGADSRYAVTRILLTPAKSR
jgi:hypothetical protein